MPAFFGLTQNDKANVILEPFFALTYYAGMSWETYYDFPVAYKHWLIKRIEKEINAKAEKGDDVVSKAPHHNSRDVRELTGKTKTTTSSAKMQRFT